jgi:hypothetical protein
MARERWFFAKDNRRMGPFPRRQLVESLLALPDPRTSLVWRHGLPAWTPAAEVPEIERLLAPFAPGKEAEPARERASPAGAGPDASGRFEARPAARPGARSKTPAKGGPGLGPLLYGGVGLAVVVVALLAWLLWPAHRSNETGTSTADPGPGAPAVSPAPGPDGAPDSTGVGSASFAGWAEEEADLPASELKRLRGVAGWSGDTLTITVFNGSTWRVTELLVRTSRLKNQSIDDETPKRLLPAGELRKAVAPDRKKAGVNPRDTGPFEGVVGAQPAAYSWSIDGARGYPARSAP